MRRIEQEMSGRPATVGEGVSSHSLVYLIAQSRVAAVVVVDAAEHPVGVVTIRELLGPRDDGLPEQFVHPSRLGSIRASAVAREVMSPVALIAPGACIAEAARVLLESGAAHAVVVDDAGDVLGLVRRGDLARSPSRVAWSVCARRERQ